MMFQLARVWACAYGLLKDRFDVHLPGLGFALRLVRSDRIMSVAGRRMFFNHRVASSYARPIAGHWNEPETHVLLNYVIASVPRSVAFVDIGANIGEMTVDVSRHANVARIVAFEPIAECCKSVRKSLELNGFGAFRIVEKLVGAEVGHRKFAVSSDPQISSILSAASAQAGAEVPMTTLDEEIGDLSDHEVIILIDVEGYEPAVLEGGGKFIRARRPLIIFEYNRVSKQHYSSADIRRLLGEDYTIYRLRQDGRLDRDIEHAWNCVAVPASSVFTDIAAKIVVPG